MKKILIFCVFFLVSCNYQPIYQNTDLDKIEFLKITLEGDQDINRKIINSLSLKENEYDDTLNELRIKSSYEIQETSKNSKGQVQSYRSQIIVNLDIKNKGKSILNKDYVEDFSYANKDNKFELVQYQDEIKNNLINKVIEDVILFLKLQ
mgnify:CR=1 FL=1|tara:strand:- start:15 stop:464 length:450 start_codon:yes stop_codon:yes gene_type:complete